MTLNEKKLTEMVEAVKDETVNHLIEKHKILNELFDVNVFLLNEWSLFEPILRTALTPFCMEMTDEEIEEAAIINNPQETNEYGHNLHSEAVLSVVRYGFVHGAKFIRDGK